MEIRNRTRPLERVRGRWLLCIAAVVFTTLASGLNREAWAQTWEFSPYRIQVWYGGTALLRENGLPDEVFEDRLKEHCRVSAGAAWRLEFGDVPDFVRPDLTDNIEGVSGELIAKIVDPPREAEEVLTETAVDKVYLLGLRSTRGVLEWQVREFDVRTVTWSDVARIPVSGRTSIIRGAFQGMAETFRPILRIETSEGRDAKGRIRAAGLVIHDYAPAAVRPGAIVQPVIRKNDRSGQLVENGIEVVEWTLGVVGESETNLVPIKLHSAFANPFGVRVSKRKVKLALVESHRYPKTRLFLKSRDEEQRPMAGYEIYAKDPISGNQKLLGITDWRGAIDIEPQEELPLFLVLYVRNGGQLLSRLPMQIGAHREVVANVYDDNRRLRAEAFVKAIQGNVLELVASRELAAARARKHIEMGQFDEAMEQVANMRRMTGPDDLRDRLNAEQGRIWEGVERRDKRVDAQFTKTLKMIATFLPRDLPDNIAAEVEAARNAK